MRITYLTLGDVKYPMCMSLTSIERIEEEFGSLEQMMESLTYSSAGGLTNVIRAAETVLGIFLDAGRVYSTSRGETVPPLPDCRITDMLGMDDGLDFAGLVNTVISDSTEREVEAEPSKKEEATEALPAEADRGSAFPPDKPG